MYSQKTLEIFKKPTNYGTIKGASGVGKVRNKETGDLTKIYIKVENDIIEEATFQTFGGVVSIAAASVAASLIEGKTTFTAEKYEERDILLVLGSVDENKMYGVELAVDAIIAAVANYRKKNSIVVTPRANARKLKNDAETEQEEEDITIDSVESLAEKLSKALKKLKEEE